MPNGQLRAILRTSAFWSILLVAGSFSSPAVAQKANHTLPNGFESQLVELYSKNRCDEIVRRTNPRNIYALRPNVMAIVASCDPNWGNAEEIFSRAEALEPTGDLILVLHARYRTRKDTKSAQDLWNRVLIVARNPAFIEMAKDYFSGK